MKLRVLIAADEHLAKEKLIDLLSKELDIELCPTASSGMETVKLVRDFKPDALFLDIEMPGIDGFQTARLLQDLDFRPFVIFTTASDQYALEAFEIGAMDYLLKPYGEERLRQTLDRLRERKSGTEKQVVNESSEDAAVPTKESIRSFGKLLVEAYDRIMVLDTDTIVYAVKEEKFTRIYTTDGRCYTSKQTLHELGQRLGAAFFRPHRSYLLNLNFIQEIEPWANGAYNAVLKLPEQIKIPVSRNEIKDMLLLLQGK
jgi:two-component system response regulator LytT